MAKRMRKTDQEKLDFIDQQIKEFTVKKERAINRYDSKLADLASQKQDFIRSMRQKDLDAIASYIDEKQIDLNALHEFFSQIAQAHFSVDQMFSLMSSLEKHQKSPEAVMYLLSQLEKMDCSVDLAFQIIQNAPKESLKVASGH